MSSSKNQPASKVSVGANRPPIERAGFCIYCGSVNDLTDEHIIPEGLGGTAKLLKASCRRCATMTSKFEMVFLRQMLPLYRRYFQIPGKKKKRRAKSDYTTVQVGGVPLLVEMDDLPLLVALPCPNGPRLLGRDLVEAERYALVLHLPPRRNRVRLAGIELETTIAAGAFAQSLAKIAHAALYRYYAPDEIEPLLLGLIRGDFYVLDDWFGSEAIEESESFHFRLSLNEEVHLGEPYIVAHCLALAHMGSAAHFWFPVAKLSDSTTAT